MPLDWLLRTKKDRWNAARLVAERLLRSPKMTKKKRLGDAEITGLNKERLRMLPQIAEVTELIFFQNKQNKREDERALWL